MTRLHPDLTALEILVAVAGQGSLGAAGRLLGMAQPNVSRCLARLERQLGIALVVRTPTGSSLTTEGTVVVEWAREALESVERVVEGGRALGAGRRSHLRVSASMTVAEYLVPSWLGELRRESPGSMVRLHVANSIEVVEAVVQGRADLGFVESPSVPRTVHSTSVGRDQLLVVVHPGHAWARRRQPLGLTELAATPLIVREARSGTRETLERVLARNGLAPVPPELELSSNAAVKISAASGLGPAVLSELAVAGSVRTGELVAVALEGAPIRRRLRAVWRPPARPTGPVADLVRIARRAADQLR